MYNKQLGISGERLRIECNNLHMHHAPSPPHTLHTLLIVSLDQSHVGGIQSLTKFIHVFCITYVPCVSKQ